jgi:hypothetical protein
MIVLRAGKVPGFRALESDLCVLDAIRPATPALGEETARFADLGGAGLANLAALASVAVTKGSDGARARGIHARRAAARPLLQRRDTPGTAAIERWPVRGDSE